MKVPMSNRGPEEPVATGNRFVQVLEEEESCECDGGATSNDDKPRTVLKPDSTGYLVRVLGVVEGWWWGGWKERQRFEGERESVRGRSNKNALLFFETEPNKPE
jgi:hypothetical protein